MGTNRALTIQPSREVQAEARRRAEQAAEGLYPHQIEGLAFLLGRRRAILADDMGLGKTRQSIIAMHQAEPEGPYLVVCPASVKRNWVREIEQALPGSECHLVGEAPPAEFKGWVVVNYELLKKHNDTLAKLPLVGLIFDEAHYLKNHNSQRSRYARSLVSSAGDRPVVHCLTGTPLTNRPRDLFPLLQLVKHPLAKSFYTFARKYCSAYDNGYGLVTDGASNLEELAVQLHGVMLRRTKDEVLDLPPKVRTYLEVPVADGVASTEMRRVVASLLESRTQQASGEAPAPTTRAAGRERVQLLSLLTKARLKIAKAKVKSTVDFVEGVVNQGEKVIVFSSYDAPVQAIAKKFGEQAVLLTGSTPANRRQDLVDRFQNDPDVRVFVANLIAGGIGLNLTAGTQVVFNDLDWVPANHWQAEDRAYRIGQTRIVQATYMVAEGTVDEFVKSVLETKAAIVGAVVDGSALNGEVSRDILTDLEDMLSRVSPGLADTPSQPDPAWIEKAIREAAAKYKAEHATEVAKGVVKRPQISEEAIELLVKALSGPQSTRFKAVSSSKPDQFYEITVEDQDAECTCPGFHYRGTCRHVVQLKTALAEGGPLPRGISAA